MKEVLKSEHIGEHANRTRVIKEDLVVCCLLCRGICR